MLWNGAMVLAYDSAALGIEPGQFDALVVGAGGDQVAGGIPSQAIDGALVVLGALEQHGGLIRLVVMSEIRSS